MSASEPSPLAYEWDDEKNASIDWTDIEDVCGNGFTFVQLLCAHPRLAAFFANQASEKEHFKAVFLSPDRRKEQEEALQRWHADHLLSLRAARWCRRCGREGHTRARCSVRHGVEMETSRSSATTLSTPPTSRLSEVSKVMQKYHAHQQHLARLKLLGEKTKRLESRAGKGGTGLASFGGPARGGGGGAGSLHAHRGQRGSALGARERVLEGALFTEERRHGVVVRIDGTNGIGFVRTPESREAKFFLDNTGYGVKTIAVGDAVSFKLDESRGFPVANDVHPEKSVITEFDVVQFIELCKKHKQPITLLAMLLMHRNEWEEVLVHIRHFADREAFADGMHTLVELTTFIENREPIHLTMLESFLALTVTEHLSGGAGAGAASPAVGVVAQDEAGGKNGNPGFLLGSQVAGGVSPPPSSSVTRLGATPPSFLPMLHEALTWDAEATQRMAPTPGTEAALLRYSERWIEVVNYLVLLRQYTAVTSEVLTGVQTLLRGLLLRRLGANPPPANHLQLAHACRRLDAAAAVECSGAMFLPSAADFAGSLFAPEHLPIHGVERYTSQEDFIRAHCRLLWADTFYATSRLVRALCFDLPDSEPSAETRSDMAHARVFDRVRFLARVLADDRDFAEPAGYILQVQPRHAGVDFASSLQPGTTICLTTSLDKTNVAAEELFWGVVASRNARLLGAHAIVVTPCEFSLPFTLLQARLLRNEAAGRAECSLLLETEIFMAGYMSIMKALRAFLGPLAMALPMAWLLMPRPDRSKAAGTSSGVVSPSPPSPFTPGLAEVGLGGGTVMAVSAGPSTRRFLPHIPRHCAYAFQELIAGIRGRFRLDAGQDLLMRELPYSEVLLVQGPPGTGKSFIGCRVVETYVRYKQLLASGDILQRVDVDLLPCARVEEMLPVMGPIVVITYKNHALDEFLIDMLDSGLWDEKRPQVGQQLVAYGGAAYQSPGVSFVNSLDLFPAGRRLVRIGGRSKEPRLDPNNLGSLLHTMPDKSAIRSLRERIAVLQQRLERLTKEIHYLEKGKVPKAYFLRWLTPEQQQHITFEQREEWLRGERYIGQPIQGQDKQFHPRLFLEILRTELGAALDEDTSNKNRGDRPNAEARARDKEPTVRPGSAAPSVSLGFPEKNDEDATAGVTEDVSLSVFQEMKRENESREFNTALDGTYLSREAIYLAEYPPLLPANVPDQLLSLWSLDPITRHRYYAYLIQRTISIKAKTCLVLMQTIENVVRIRNHAVDEAKLTLLRGADVVGLTTTGCAMNQNLLRSLRPSILVVEEAAEVLELQLLACMTDSLRQIILIGDHYQLQPKVETFLYEKINHMNLSLFERLTREIRPIRLTEQRRMHPGIAALVRPFYDDQPLIDHASVHTRPFVLADGTLLRDRLPGLVERVFFWRHDHPEEEMPGSRSKINTREIWMVQALARHLVAEGALQASITVLTPYLAQRRVLSSVLRLSSLPNVRVSTVDLFQGDENDLILLSMTRTEKLTDFIRMRNRLIVACSRARFGMVILGNDTLLRRSPHWAEVLSWLDAKGCVGDRLPVCYRARPGEVNWLEPARVPATKEALWEWMERIGLAEPNKETPRERGGCAET